MNQLLCQQIRCGWLLSALLILSSSGLLFSQSPDNFNPGADYLIDTLALQPDGRLLVGGSFGKLGGQVCSALGRLNEDGSYDSTFLPAASGDVISIAVQPDGQILVGGYFSSLGGQNRTNIARLHNNGALDYTFNPGANNTVHCLALQADGRILVGGKFTMLGGQSRACIGRLNIDGSLDTSFNPGANNDVYALAVQADGKILVGGVFTTLGGQARNYLGRLNADGTSDSTFNPGADNTVLTLAVLADSKIMVGGSFATLGGQTRNYIGRLNLDGTLDTTFTNLATSPVAANCGVYSLVVQSDGKVLAGGLFDTVGGQTRNSIVCLNADGTVDGSFNSGASFTVYALALQSDGKVLAAGQFTSLGGQPRQYLGRLNSSSMAIQDLTRDGLDINWTRGGSSPEVWRTTFEVTTNGNDWFLLGAGQRVAGAWKLAGVDLATNATIRARGFLAAGRENGSAWFVEAMRGSPAISQPPLSRTNNAGTSASFRVLAGGLPLSYQWLKDGVPLVDGGKISGVQTPTLSLSNVFGADAGGYSVTVSNGSGCVTSSVAALTVLDPFIATQPVNRMANAGQTVTFSVTAGGTAPLAYQWRKSGTDLVDSTNSSLILTNVQWANRGSYDVRISNSLNTLTSSVATLTISLTYPDSLSTSANSDIEAVALQADGRILLGGKFTTVGGYARSHLARLNSSGVVDSNFSIGTTGGMYPTVSAIAALPDGKILIGGDFTAVNGQTRTNLARINPDGTLDASFDTPAGGVSASAVSALSVQSDGKILVGGWFTSLGGQSRLNIGRLNPDGSVDSSFNPGASGSYPGVYTIALQSDGKILVGGAFTSLAGQARSHIGRLNFDGTIDTSWNPGASGSVLSLAVQSDGKVVVGGLFSTLGGQTRNNLGRLQPNGTLDTSFNPGASWSVSSIAPQTDGKLLVGGAFTTLAGQPRFYLGRLNSDGSSDPTFGSTTSGYVNALALQSDGRILVGGHFSILGSQFRNNFGRLENSDPATQNLICDNDSLTWERSGTCPEISWATFEVSTNAKDWVRLGDGNRVIGGWQFIGMPSLLTNSTLRARGYTTGGYHNGSGYLVEQTLGIVPRIPPRILTEQSDFGMFRNRFRFSVAGLYSQIIIIETSTNLQHWQPLQTNTFGVTPILFGDTEARRFPQRFYRVRLQ